MFKNVFLLFFSCYAIAQQTPKNVLLIQYKFGHYNFGNVGEYEHVEVFKFVEYQDKIYLEEVQSISKKYIYNPETSKNDLSVSDTIKKSPNRKLSEKLFDNLNKELSIGANNFTFDFVRQSMPKKISSKQILKVAKDRQREYWLLDEESGKFDSFGKDVIKEINAYRSFEEFTESVRPKIDQFTIIADAWNFAEIVGDNLDLKRLDFHSPLGQPIQTKTSSDDWLRTINLNVNLILMKILPKKSLLYKELEFSNLTDAYIGWYIEKKINSFDWSSNGS